VLERYAMKVARTVLRGGSGSNATSLPDQSLSGPRAKLIYSRTTSEGVDMAEYQYIHIEALGKGSDKLRIYGTDKAALEWAVDEVRKYCPSARVKLEWVLPDSEPYLYLIENIRGKMPQLSQEFTAIYMVAWLIKQLCKRGWKPFVISKEYSVVYGMALLKQVD
jgi:hypothetical protein